MKSILRWAGSKKQLIPKLQEFWPGRNTRYVEPFCGSACLFFALQPSMAILGDLNAELIETYRTLQSEPLPVIEALKKLKRSEREYYRIRSLPPEEMGAIDRTARFLYLNRHCFNGIYRTNSDGEFNVPYGPQKRNSAICEETILIAAKLLKNADLVAADFTTTLNRVKRGDFVYLDPPYVVQKRRIFREYHPQSFGINALDVLGVWLDELHSRGAQFVISYCDSAEARELLQKWQPRRVRTRRNIAGFASDRRHAYELLASNLSCPSC